MGLTVENVRLGRSNATAFHQRSERWAIVLPGAGYSAQAPLLWFARRAALQAGHNALVVTDVFDGESDDPIRWVQERTEATLGYVRPKDPHPLLIAKSLTSLAAGVAAAERLPAVWFTPLIAEPQILAGLHAGTEPKLLIGGSDDPSWDANAANTLPNADVLELAGADHSLEAPNDVAESLENLKRATDAVHKFVARVSAARGAHKGQT
jgi:hypothetical protein